MKGDLFWWILLMAVASGVWASLDAYFGWGLYAF